MEKETLILEHLKANPFISQQQLAEKVNLSRSSVANYIGSLTAQGKIKGRAYIFPKEKVITCIGGANVDRKAQTKEAIRYHSSNPVTMSESFGGVARNVAENLAALGHEVSFLSIVGNDKEGQAILEDTKGLGIDVQLTEVVPGGRTGTYTALLDLSGEMAVSLANMDIYDQLTPEVVERKWSQVAGSQAIFLDTNAPAETLAYMVRRCAEDGLTLFIDPVSSLKSRKLPQDLTGVTVLLPNLEEAEELTGMKIETSADYSKATEIIRGRGVNSVVITLGEAGIFYSTPEGSGQMVPYPVEIVDVTGAGDALTAGILSGVVQGYPLKEACKYGLAAAAFALATEQSASPDLSLEKITAWIKEHE